MSLVIRLWNLFRGLSSRAISIFERRNPEALLELERENLRKLIGQFNQGLVSHAAISERLSTEVKRGTAKSAELTARIQALVKAGEREAAARYALELKEVDARLADDREQLAGSESTFHQLVSTRDQAVVEARRKIELVRRDIGDLKVKRAIADLEGMAQSMINSVASPGDSINRLHEMVIEEREKAAAQVRVNSRQLAPEELRLREREREALAADALDAFLRESELPPDEPLPAQPMRMLPDLSMEATPVPVARKPRDIN